MDATSFLKSKFFQLRLYGVLTIMLFIAAGYFTYTNVMNFLEIREQVTNNEVLFEGLDNNSQQIEAELRKVKEENIDLIQTIQNQLDVVLPKSEDYTSLTRSLDNFASEIHRLKNPFLISNLQYSKSKGDSELAYEIMPFKMTIQSSFDNFFKFLKFVETSGTLSDETRLIDIQSIIINFVTPTGTEGNTSGRDEINFNVAMNAYYRSPEK